MKLTKDDFHKWDDKYPNELMIDSDNPKELASEILKNQEIIEVMEKDFTKNYEIVQRLKERYAWLMDNPNKLNGNIAYELQKILGENQ